MTNADSSAPDADLAIPSDRVVTERLLIRAWGPADAELLRDAIDSSMDHLMAWLPWAHLEPADLEATTERLLGYEEAFASGDDFVYGMFTPDETEVVGGIGLHPRVGDGALEIGYWVREGRINQGYATEAAGALTRVGFGVEGIDCLQIHLDPQNRASRAIPEKLGYRLWLKRVGDSEDSKGKPRDTLVFRMTREEWALMESST